VLKVEKEAPTQSLPPSPPPLQDPESPTGEGNPTFPIYPLGVWDGALMGIKFHAL